MKNKNKNNDKRKHGYIYYRGVHVRELVIELLSGFLRRLGFPTIPQIKSYIHH